MPISHPYLPLWMFFSKDMDNLVPHKGLIWQTDDVRNDFSVAISQINPMPHFGKLMHSVEAP